MKKLTMIALVATLAAMATVCASAQATPPTVSESAPTGVTAVGALLNGAVDPNGSATNYGFEYGETTHYEDATTALSAGSGSSSVPVVAAISDLAPGRTYYERLVAANSSGEAFGSGQSFTTPSLEWRLGDSALPYAVSVGWSGRTKLSVEGLPNLIVECEDSASGLAGAGNGGELSTWSASKCVSGAKEEGQTTCKNGTISLTALNLPWHLELTSVEGATREVLSNGGKGTPGYKMECQTKLGLHAEEQCSGSLDATLANGSEGVTAMPVEKLGCGGKGGEVEGAQTLTASAGGTLSAVDSAEIVGLSGANWYYKATRAIDLVTTTQTGSIKLSVEGLANLAVECEDGATGVAGPGNDGEVSAWTASKCVSAAAEEGPTTCKNGTISLTALDLPWRSELVRVAGAIREVVTADGKGTPGYKMECQSKLGLRAEQQCTGALVATVTNLSEAVAATPLLSEKLKCGGGRGEAEGVQVLAATTGGKLEVK